jgi:hypothetical protein
MRETFITGPRWAKAEWQTHVFANKIAYANQDKFGTEDAMRIGRLHTLMGGWEETMIGFTNSGRYKLSTQVASLQQIEDQDNMGTPNMRAPAGVGSAHAHKTSCGRPVAWLSARKSSTRQSPQVSANFEHLVIIFKVQGPPPFLSLASGHE